ncbi:MAG: winged helix-turn-helix transcriptional regulator [Candidatus Odinarchaeota archaeon]
MQLAVDGECPVFHALKIVGRKWMLSIFAELYSNGKLYFTDLLTELQKNGFEKISAKVLSDNLSLMEENFLIKREVDTSGSPVRVQYSLTEMGEDLETVFGMVKAWATKWCGNDQSQCNHINCTHKSVPTLPLDKVKAMLIWEDE